MIKKIYSNLPKRLKSHISKISSSVKNKPKALPNKEAARFPQNAKGGVIISADLELGWAVRFSKENKDPEEFASRERENMPVIVKHLENFGIPIVWATVGHLFLHECHKGDHDWMRRIPYFDDHWCYKSGDWFDCDPCTDYKNDPAWYAPDLIDMILNSRIPHEIACHTFSHIDCSYKNCPPGVLEDELKACFDAAKRWGIQFKSITFPGGTAGNYETLLDYGITICRKRHLDYELSYPFLETSGMIISPTGPCIALGYKNWSMEYRFQKMKKAIDKAIDTNTVVHFWFHPSQEKETFSALLPMLLKYCADKRESNELWVGTMNEMAEFIKSSHSSL